MSFFWPKTLFARLLLLMFGVIVAAQLVTWSALRQDRERRLATQFTQTKIAQIQGIRNALDSVPRGQRQSAFAQLSRDYGAFIVPVDRRPEIGVAPRSASFALLTEQLRTEFGPNTELRLGAREGIPVLWIRLSASDQAFWIGLPADLKAERVPWRVTGLVALLVGLLLVTAYVFARRAAAPLKLLANAATMIGRGQRPAQIPETGPAEVAAVARGFNQMRDNLAKSEDERAVMLAGVSHDIRTPLTRLKLELEMAGLPDATKQSMSLEVEEIERMLGQFLDFARGSTADALALQSFPALPWLSERVARERVRRGETVTLVCDDRLMIHGNLASLDRAIANLIDNAFRYGSASVDLRAHAISAAVIAIEVADRGPGIAPDDLDRLLRPFTRGNEARSDASGAGLGLAIVERIVRLHQGSLVVTAREGGGTTFSIHLPVERTENADAATGWALTRS